MAARYIEITWPSIDGRRLLSFAGRTGRHSYDVETWGRVIPWERVTQIELHAVNGACDNSVRIDYLDGKGEPTDMHLNWEAADAFREWWAKVQVAAPGEYVTVKKEW